MLKMSRALEFFVFAVRFTNRYTKSLFASAIELKSPDRLERVWKMFDQRPFLVEGPRYRDNIKPS